MMQATAFNYSDVQGIVRFGHGHLKEARFLLLRIKEAESARQWLAELPVTSAEALRPLPRHAVQAAFTAQGLTKLGLDPALLEAFSDEFLTGMTEPNRARRLGDTGDNAPGNWAWGGTENAMPDVLLMCYGQSGHIQKWLAEVFEDSFDRAFHVIANFPTHPRIDREPFGFADGISQPKIDWERRQTADVHRRDRYSNLLSLGEVLLGYPNEYGEYTPRPVLPDRNVDLPPSLEDESCSDLGRNGSYLVLRQLEQDVSGFWRFVDTLADGDAERREELAAALVGRRKSGAPLVPISEADIEGIAEQKRAANNFLFDMDPHGMQCPIASHVRRSNPRTGDFPPGRMGIIKRFLRILGFDARHRQQDLVASTRFHRLLRRGRPYGPGVSQDQALAGQNGEAPSGLQFVCLSANIARQFEFVQNAWIVNSKFAGLQDSEDPLLGNRRPLSGGTATGNFTRPDASGLRQCTRGMDAFVRIRGGAFFFLPGIRAYRYICGQQGKS
jgi:deferrochelatase/peroxidase EfeB